jgi:hypothetical protein
VNGQRGHARWGCWPPVVSYSHSGTTRLPVGRHGVPSMARPRPTATTATPARALSKRAGRAKSTQPASGRQKTRQGREAAAKATTAKPNPFDDIARQVNADQEAKDREAGRDDLTPALAKSVDQVKVQRAATKPAKPARPTKPAPPPKPAKPATLAKPARPTKVQANGKSAFSGRPVTKPEAVGERAKQLGLRVRADADVDAIAARLRATPDAVSAWLASRNGQPPKVTKVATKAPAKQTTAKAPSIDLQHAWSGPVPKGIPELKGASLVMRYEVWPDDGTVWSTLHQVLGPDGKVLEDFWRLPLDYRPQPEVQGNGRKLVLKDRTIAGLQTWLIKQGLTTPEDITV